MKTIEERAERLIKEISGCCNNYQKIDLIVEYFKQEQKLTRHACAKETDRLYFIIDNRAIDRITVRHTILNTKTV